MHNRRIFSARPLQRSAKKLQFLSLQRIRGLQNDHSMLGVARDGPSLDGQLNAKGRRCQRDSQQHDGRASEKRDGGLQVTSNRRME
jgi:hypothetical protein